MSESFPGPDPDAPRPDLAEGQPGDLPPDFLEDVAEPSPFPKGPEDLPEPEALTHAHTFDAAEHAATEDWAVSDVPAFETEPAEVPAGIEPPAAPETSSAFPVVLGLGLIAAVVAAVVLAERERKAETPAANPAVAAAPEAPKPTEPDPTSVLAEDVKKVQGLVEGLSEQVKAVQARLDALPKPQPPVDIEPVKARIDGLGKTVEDLGKTVTGLAPLGDKVAGIAEQVGGFDASVKSLRDELGKLQESMKAQPQPKPAETAAATPADAAKPATSPAADVSAGLTQGAALFQAGKYPEAKDAFAKLAAGDPKDARVFYYAAMSNGAATGDWRGETERLVNRGIELEKAGTPAASEIDAAFSGLATTLKPWLDAYRARAR